MGRTCENFVVKNAADLILAKTGHLEESNIRQEEVSFLIDTGADSIFITQDIQNRLKLLESAGKLIIVGGGKKILCKRLRPVELWWHDREYTSDVFIMPGQQRPIMGVLGLEALFLRVNPHSQAVESLPEEEACGQML